MKDITRIEKTNLNAFASYLSPNLMEEIRVGSARAIGAVLDGVAAGVACFYPEYNEPLDEWIIRIKWIYVHPDLRNKGLGTLLIDGIISTADDFGAEAVTCDFDMNDEYIRHFLEGWDFNFEKGMGPEIGISLRDIKDYRGVMDYSEGVFPLGDLELPRAKILLREFLKENGYRGFLTEAELPNDYFDMDHSCFMGTERFPKALLLAHRAPEGEIVADYIGSLDPEVENDISLLCYACAEAIAKYSKDSMILIRPGTLDFVVNLDTDQLFKKYLILDRMEAALQRDQWEENYSEHEEQE